MASLSRIAEHSNGCCAGFEPASLFTQSIGCFGHRVCVYSFVSLLYPNEEKASNSISALNRAVCGGLGFYGSVIPRSLGLSSIRVRRMAMRRDSGPKLSWNL